MSEMRPPRRRVAGDRARTRRPAPEATAAPAEEQAPARPVETADRTAAPPAEETGAPPAEPAAAVPAHPHSPVAVRKESRAAEPGSPYAAGPAPRGPVFVLATVLSLVLVAGVAAAGVLFYRVRQAEGATSAGTAATAAARSHAQKVLSYDYRTLDKSFAAAESSLTGDFTTEYT